MLAGDTRGHKLRLFCSAIMTTIRIHSITSDLGDKAAEYLALDTVFAYLVLSQDEPKAWVWVRNESGFPPGPEVLAETDGAVRIPALSIDLPPSEIYRGIASD